MERLFDVLCWACGFGGITVLFTDDKAILLTVFYLCTFTVGMWLGMTFGKKSR